MAFVLTATLTGIVPLQVFADDEPPEAIAPSAVAVEAAGDAEDTNAPDAGEGTEDTNAPEPGESAEAAADAPEPGEVAATVPEEERAEEATDSAGEEDPELDGSFMTLEHTDWYTLGSSPYTLANAEDLAGLAQLVNAGTDDFSGDTIILGGNILGVNLAPIGTLEHPFNGVFNGNSKSIVSLELTTTRTTYVGLFGYAGATSTIKNLTLSGGTITVAVAAANGPQIRYVGAIAGYSAGAVENCSSSAALVISSQRAAIAGQTVSSPTEKIGSIREVGGLVGHLDGSLSGSSHTGTITVSTGTVAVLDDMKYLVGEVGGLVGAAGGPIAATPLIANSSNSGAISFTVAGAGGVDRFGQPIYSASCGIGGIVGVSSGSIRACTNTGNINTSTGTLANPTAGFGGSNTGGIVGLHRGNSFDLNATDQDIHAVTSDPGFAAWQDSHPVYPTVVGVYDCKNTGTVIGLSGVGGIAGGNGSFVEIEGCSNTGDVKGCRWNKPFVGGIGGTILGDIRYCYNAGNIYSVTGAGYYCAGIAGGFTSRVNAATPDELRYPAIEMTGCYVSGQVMLTVTAFRTGILAGESNGYIHDNVYHRAVTVDHEIVDTDSGTVINNLEVENPVDIKNITSIAKLNSFAATTNGWSVFYLPDTANANGGYPVLSRVFNTTGTDINTIGAAATLASNARYSAAHDPVPTITLSSSRGTLIQNGDFRVIAQTATAGAAAGSTVYQATIIGIGNYRGTLSATVSYQIGKGSIADCTIVAQPTIFNWEQQKPTAATVKVLDAAGNEVSPSEYNLIDLANDGSNATAQGGKYYDYKYVHGDVYKYDVKVQAKPSSPNYEGEKTQAAYRIGWADMMYDGVITDPPRPEGVVYDKVVFGGQEWDYLTALADTSGNTVQITYTGSAIRPKVANVTYLGRPMTDGTGLPYYNTPLLYDYKYVYGNPNPEEGNDQSKGAQVNVTPANQPECMTVRFTMGGNFHNYVNVFYRIVPASLTSVNAAPIPEKTTTGSAITPLPTLTYNGKTLANGVDYTLSYRNNTAAGTGYVTVTGKGNYSGTKELPFTIVAPAFDGKVVTFTTKLPGGRTIDMPGSSLLAGTQAILWDGGVSANQRYRITSTGNGFYKIENLNSGLCLDISGGQMKKNSAIIQWRYLGTSNQQWAITANADGTYTISSAKDQSFCMDVSGGVASNGATLILWEKGASQQTNQSFRINTIVPTIPEGTYIITTKAPGGRSIDVTGSSTVRGAAVILWDLHRGENQQFVLRYQAATGYYTITNKKSGLSLDVTGGSTSKGTPVIQWDLHGGLNQQWAVVDDGRGAYYIQSAKSGVSIDVSGSISGNGGAIIIWPLHGADNQRWKLESQV
jgi:hypothetical protein